MIVTYYAVLPELFPAWAWVTEEDALGITAVLVSNEVLTADGHQTRAGSSFAVVAGIVMAPAPNMRRLYVSAASLSRITAAARWPHVQWHHAHSPH
jgi:hypothetical protein